MTQASDKWRSRSDEAEEEQVVETEEAEGVARMTCTLKFAVLVEGIYSFVHGHCSVSLIPDMPFTPSLYIYPINCA